MFEIFRLVGCAEDVRIGGIRLLETHPVAKAGGIEIRAHLGTSTEFIDELLIEPRLVNAQFRIDHQPIAVEALDVISFIGAAVTPDVDIVFLHRRHQHGAGHGASERRGVEVGQAGRGDVKRPGLNRRESLRDQLGAAINQSGVLGAVLHRPARNVIVIILVRLSEIRGVGVRNRPLLTRPVERRAGIETTRKGDTDLFADWKRFENVSHCRKYLRCLAGMARMWFPAQIGPIGGHYPTSPGIMAKPLILPRVTGRSTTRRRTDGIARNIPKSPLNGAEPMSQLSTQDVRRVIIQSGFDGSLDTESCGKRLQSRIFEITSATLA